MFEDIYYVTVIPFLEEVGIMTGWTVGSLLSGAIFLFGTLLIAAVGNLINAMPKSINRFFYINPNKTFYILFMLFSIGAWYKINIQYGNNVFMQYNGDFEIDLLQAINLFPSGLQFMQLSGRVKNRMANNFIWLVILSDISFVFFGIGLSGGYTPGEVILMLFGDPGRFVVYLIIAVIGGYGAEVIFHACVTTIFPKAKTI